MGEECVYLGCSPYPLLEGEDVGLNELPVADACKNPLEETDWSPKWALLSLKGLLVA